MIVELIYRKGFRDENGKKHSIRSLVQCNECGKQRLTNKHDAIKRSPENYCHKCASKKNYYTTDRRKVLADYLELSETTGYKLLTNDIPELSTTKISWECPNGHIVQKSFNNLNQKVIGCRQCDKPIKIEVDYYDLAKQHNVIYLGPFPENSHIKTNWMCTCGNMIRASYDVIIRGTKCKPCGYKKSGNSNRNPNLTDEDRERGRYFTELKEWRKDVYKLYEYTCQNCYKTNCEVCAHHIFNWADYKSLRFVVNNGIVLCRKCHTAFHTFVGVRKPTNLEQLETFLGRHLKSSIRLSLLAQFEVKETRSEPPGVSDLSLSQVSLV